MRKILFIFLMLPFVGVNAQIFINTNPNSKGTEGTVVKETKKVDETKKEIETTKTEVEEVKKTITSPNFKTDEGSNTTNVSGTKVSDKNVTETKKTETEVKDKNVSTSTPTITTTKTNTDNTTEMSSKKSTTVVSSTPTPIMSSVSEDVPPNAQPGKCYARCQTEDQYAFNTKQVIASPRTVKRILLPALYTTVYDTIITRPKSVKYEDVPAEYETVREQKMTAPATTKWIKGKADAGCLSANPEDCQVMCLVEVPAQYATVTKRVLKTEAYKREIQIPMEYKIEAKQVKTQNERYVEQVIPETYKTVQERVLVKKGGYQGWKEILCASDLDVAKITAIQLALKAAGYNPGPIDNIFGVRTKEALKAYQRAKGLPVGNLNLETLKSLGVN